MFKTATIRKSLILLGLILTTACGSSMRPGAEGIPFVPAPKTDGNPIIEVNDIILFATKEIYMGNLAQYAPSGSLNRARDGADALCNQYKIAAWNDREVHALIAVDANDDLINMPKIFNIPTDQKIVGDTGVEIAKQWSDLLDSSIEVTLQHAVKNLSGTEDYWTGALKNGSTDSTDNCSNWTAVTGTGITGFATYDTAEWLSAKSNPCDVAKQILCVAF